ncbi:hypothetical protein EB796_020423 [Bugula neritina]|uniref:Uncharacterized protein n=1 Tax=Bugula neritina TaxID=10212 RepID=A0A7J7J4Z9_BUGNE|nr:hypothetical protein EB796_020423 [Bugula neritina]
MEDDMQSDNEDHEAEQIEPGNRNVAGANILPIHRQNERANHAANYSPAANSDTVHSILSSISNPNAAVVIPLDDHAADGDVEIDADRMARFYSGALSAITKMRRQTQKTETRIGNLRDEVGHTTMQAWTEEHYDSLQHT